MVTETECLNIRMLRADKVALRRLAKLEGEPISVIVRRVLRHELRTHNLLNFTHRDINKDIHSNQTKD